MAWLTDLAWCEPPFTELTDSAFRVWCHSLSYSSGMQTKGFLTIAQQKLCGANRKTRGELVVHGLWDEMNGGEVYISGWAERNGRADARREADRDRKRAERKRLSLVPDVSAGQGADT